MADLVETPQWEPGIYEFTTDDLVEGGPNGIDNLPTRQLANRTAFLKGLCESLGLDKQPLDATLTALAALTTAANKLIYATGADTFGTTDLTAFARTLLDDADAATMRATLGSYGITEVKALFSATDAAPVFACRAWVNFNGTGTVAIRGSGNVSSITDNGVGDYTINFNTALPDGNYAFSGVAGKTSSRDTFIQPIPDGSPTWTTTALRISVRNQTGGNSSDEPYVAITVTR